jgi:hypothetical protein
MSVWEPSKNHSTNNHGSSVGRQPLLWLNVLCLDAPLIAIGWKWLFAREFSVLLSASATQSLFLTAWLIYALDRFSDSLSLGPNVPRSLRHEFCLRHKNVWLALIFVIAGLDASTVFRRLEHELLLIGLILGGLAAVYLLINYKFDKLWQTVPLKEVMIGFLFAAGTLFAPAARLSSATSTLAKSTFAFMAVLFAILCSLNCMSIAVWERDLDRTQGKYSIATQWPAAKLYTRVALLVLTVICIAFAFFDRGLRTFTVCLGLSSALLSALYFLPLLTDERVALADLVMLTPLALLLGQVLL